ncbi:glycosyl hydrolase family 18 protein [Aquicella lusitana]|uniref:Spore germination protein YaaH n=1 Tax=Aquicella lusitana TaxID=254246 RepID=A0A370G7S2_9COXI|nr:glycosyl hydrolase family 18 protein [Aquicella lusitana]RDI39838.1 spore germination protein YaaH [Aquicella lusitana]VVC73141.1 Putative sporulation-specific glycosylase YdhD [Aquicella lusitana]
MNYTLRILIATLLCGFFPLSYGMENVFYTLRSKDQLQNTLNHIRQHPQAIQIIVTQAFQVNEKGTVAGFVYHEMVDAAKSKSVKLMAMITNAGFDQARIHQFLSSAEAQNKALDFILSACRENHLYGVQFDFEMVSVKDKDALTHFFKLASEKLHKAGFSVSFAVVPALSDDPGPSAFLKKTYQNWSGAYDLKALGKISDFITIMSYNQHPEGTTPGPVASVPWVEKTIVHALKYVPARKISLGVPAYSLYWYTGTNPAAHSTRITTRRLEISYKHARDIVQQSQTHLKWDAREKMNYSVYERNWLNEYVYVEDAASFKAKLQLAKKYHLRGISVFRIGTEDERIWALLNKKSAHG